MKMPRKGLTQCCPAGPMVVAGKEMGCKKIVIVVVVAVADADA